MFPMFTLTVSSFLSTAVWVVPCSLSHSLRKIWDPLPPPQLLASSNGWRGGGKGGGDEKGEAGEAGESFSLVC